MLQLFALLLPQAGMVDDMIDDLGLRGQVQLATFHPDYQFAGEPVESSFTNRCVRCFCNAPAACHQMPSCALLTPQHEVCQQ